MIKRVTDRHTAIDITNLNGSSIFKNKETSNLMLRAFSDISGENPMESLIKIISKGMSCKQMKGKSNRLEY
ncbi:MAG: hypothetical protein IPO06_14315 [Leptospiraceae bacterium]|nr:hypothetical protein [Leptospiraceae bacterium]